MNRQIVSDQAPKNFAVAAACLVSYEIVAAEADFMLTVTDINPDDCIAYSFDESGCLVFHLIDGDVAGFPPPETVAKFLQEAAEVLVVRYFHGQPSAYKLVRRWVKS